MATIQEARQSIEQRRQQIEQARQTTEKARKAIPQTTQQQLRGQKGAPKGLAGRRFQRKLEETRGKVSEYEKQIKQQEQATNIYEQEVEEYLQTPQGRLQYAKEKNYKQHQYMGN